MEIEPTIQPREFEEYVVVPFNLEQPTLQCEFQLHRKILSQDFCAWKFYSTTRSETRDFILCDSNGNQIPEEEEGWITDRNAISGEISYLFLRNTICCMHVLCKPVKLPAPTPESTVFNYQFYDDKLNKVTNIQWRVQGSDMYQQLPENVLPLHKEDEILEFRKYDQQVYSDVIELPVPWKYDTKIALPFNLKALLLDNEVECKYQAVSCHFEQNGKTFTNPCELVPDLPFGVFAWHSYIGQREMKYHGFYSIPSPPEYFNKNNWKKLFGEQRKVSIRTISEDDEEERDYADLCYLELTDRGFSFFTRDDKDFVGFFNIKSVTSQSGFEIELRSLPKWPDATVNLQQTAPLPLRNKDILKMIFKELDPTEMTKVKSVCKLWASEGQQFPQVFHIRKESGSTDTEEWISEDLYDIDGAIAQH